MDMGSARGNYVAFIFRLGIKSNNAINQYNAEMKEGGGREKKTNIYILWSNKREENSSAAALESTTRGNGTGRARV
jgi:hypothetical protein